MTQPATIKIFALNFAVPAIAGGLLLLLLASKSDQQLFLHLNHFAAGFGGATFWSAATLLGNTLVAFALLLVFAGRRPEIIWASFLAIIPATLLVHSGKLFFATLRPPDVLAAELFNLIGRASGNMSFPSGHTTTAFTIGGIVFLNPKIRPEIRGFALVLAILAGLSRIAVGVHWPTDVLAGAAIGWLTAVLAVVAARSWSWGTKLLGQRILIGLLIAAAITIFVRNEATYPDAIWFQHVVAASGLAALIYNWKNIIKG